MDKSVDNLATWEPTPEEAAEIERDNRLRLWDHSRDLYDRFGALRSWEILDLFRAEGGKWNVRYQTRRHWVAPEVLVGPEYEYDTWREARAAVLALNAKADAIEAEKRKERYRVGVRLEWEELKWIAKVDATEAEKKKETA